MRKFSCLIAVVAISLVTGQRAQAQGFLDRLKQKVIDKTNQRVDNNENKAVDKALDQVDPSKQGGKSNSSGKSGNTSNSNSSNAGNNNNGSNNGAVAASYKGDQASGATAGPVTLKTYQNYDFVPGDTVLFSDDFREDQDGEFPSHWTLDHGQAVVNKVDNIPAFSLIEGNYCRVYPRMKKQQYLTDPFTIEFDYFPTRGADAPLVFLKWVNEKGSQEEAHVAYSGTGEVSTGYFSPDFSNRTPAYNEKTYPNKWHHCAMIFKNGQMKFYIDQNRVLVVPSVKFVPYAFGFGGIGQQDHPILFTNVRAASGGAMNMIGKKFTESKIVTHGITFDVDKADIKPESMGTLNMIVGVLNANPDLKFEIDGHTDNSGTPAHNLTLSQDRANAVKTQLVSMGIDASRLTTKGFGDTKPLTDNNTPEGKANNRRVEFVKM